MIYRGPITLDELFERSVPVPFSGCWIWLGALTGDGYASLKRNRVVCYGHVEAWSLTHGRRPRKGFVIDHLCKVRCCVNPAHLEHITGIENVMRGDWHKWCDGVPGQVPDFGNSSDPLDGDPFAL
jgi:hypothetical protein